MLRFGLLGCDAMIAAVAEAAVRRGDRLVAGHEVSGPWTAEFGVAAIADWEPLLDAAVCEAVLVGADGWSDRRSEAVRMLVQAGRTLVLAQPLDLSMLWAYELEMIRGDSAALLVPCLPDRLHPLVGRLRGVIEASLAETTGSLGTIESLQFERRLRDRSKESVLASFSRDADLVRALVGDPERLSTLPGASADAAWATLAVGLTAAAGIPARWQVAPAGVPGLTILLRAERGSITLVADDHDMSAWTWNDEPAATFDRGAAILRSLDDALNRRSGDVPADAIPSATWSDAARAIELAETVPRSLAKGRAIDLHREEFTEIGTFKGTMASLGCGLIMAALVVMIVATVVAGVARELGWAAAGGLLDAWPLALLAILGLFLALQVLPLVVGNRDG